MPHAQLLGLAGAFALGLATAALTQEGTAREASHATPAAGASLPGPMHAHLDGLIGSWDLRGQWRTAADQPWQEFEAQAEREWIFDGRFVRETVTSEWDGQPFEAVSYLGYDNVREEYVNLWIENASTGVQYSTGQIDAAGVTLTFEGLNSNAATGEENVWHRSVMTLAQPDRCAYAGFARDGDGNEFQNLEMVADRR